ncbi:hypothetical protein AVEN_245711-1 [Araneus ventricosus]|uniref:Uncharacterized protein n=1 Tax=Araneus ventricosus TaxID=182803 RepID=A0A4Y2FQW1_ARAVE|nr:hypothetical protein AVEN_245711-1 [Araneus ventricosus]
MNSDTQNPSRRITDRDNFYRIPNRKKTCPGALHQDGRKPFPRTEALLELFVGIFLQKRADIPEDPSSCSVTPVKRNLLLSEIKVKKITMEHNFFL